MTDDVIVDLINKEIDGDILPIETQRLRERLASDPLAQELHDELHAATRILATLKEVDPPPTLKPSVFRAIQAMAEKESRKTSKEQAFASLWETVRQHLTPNYAYAFTGGLATGAIVLALIFNAFNMPPFDESHASGTMALTAESVTVNLDKVHGTIVADHSNGTKSLNLNLSSQEDILIRVAFDPRAIHIDNIKPFEKSSTKLTIRDGEIEVQGNGSIECRIAFESASEPTPPVHVSLMSSGKSIYEKNINIDHGGR